MHDPELTRLFGALESEVELAEPDRAFADDLYNRLRTEARRAHPGRALLLAVAALALTGLVGGALVAGSGILPSPAPSETATPSPDATSSESTAESSAGAHVSAGFEPAFAYTLPTGWHIYADEQSAFGLTWTASGDGANTFEILSDLYPPVLNGDLCQQPPQWEQPHAASDLLAYLTGNPALSVSATPTTIGGLAGWSVDVVALREGGAACSASPAPGIPPGMPMPIYVVHWSDGIPGTYGLGPGGPITFVILDAGDGTTLGLTVHGDEPAFVESAQAILDSIEFANPVATERPAPTP